jgi:hypothetical protein
MLLNTPDAGNDDSHNSSAQVLGQRRSARSNRPGLCTAQFG